MTWETVALVALGLLASWVVYRELVKPKYVVTVQKTVNVNEQPEIVTVQASCPWWARLTDVWAAVEKCAYAAVMRMQSVNEDIIEANDRERALIDAKKAQIKEERDEHQRLRRRKKLAKRLGMSLAQVTDEMVREHGARVVE